MTAGEPYRSTFDSNDVEYQNIGITCFCMEYPGVPKTSCIGAPDVVRTFEEAKQYKCDVVRLDTLFPSCWNGKDLDRYVYVISFVINVSLI